MYLYVCVQNAIPVRGDPHILVVGDPGPGKSQVSSQTATWLWLHVKYIYMHIHARD